MQNGENVKLFKESVYKNNTKIHNWPTEWPKSRTVSNELRTKVLKTKKKTINRVFGKLAKLKGQSYE